MPTRQQIVEVARLWLGTPYRHQASRKGIGADCLGLIRGVYRDLYGFEPENIPPYTPNWAEIGGQETLADAGSRHLRAISPSKAHHGDVMLFRFRMGSPAKHAAIKSGDLTMIHAYSGRAVCETFITPWWERRIAYAFSFPGLRKKA